MKKEKEQPKDFESALASLETRVRQLEAGDLPLEESLKVFEEGMAEAAFCRKKLEEAEQKVEILLKGKDGTVRREPFPASGVPPVITPSPDLLVADDDVPF
ncbi:MAG: exodeoxyribonuclease VII small subunit [Acidobacteria bacterium]|nr:exodeoxyribonuclease VII small subunit [Acidobacteriota bacterium]